MTQSGGCGGGGSGGGEVTVVGSQEGEKDREEDQAVVETEYDCEREDLTQHETQSVNVWL